MKYTIEFELPNNKTIEDELQGSYVSWSIWGYSGIAKAKPVAEPKKAVWIEEYDGYADGNVVIDNWYCSNCDYCYEDFEEPNWNFCPNCGAKMEDSNE